MRPRRSRARQCSRRSPTASRSAAPRPAGWSWRCTARIAPTASPRSPARGARNPWPTAGRTAGARSTPGAPSAAGSGSGRPGRRRRPACRPSSSIPGRPSARARTRPRCCAWSSCSSRSPARLWISGAGRACWRSRPRGSGTRPCSPATTIPIAVEVAAENAARNDCAIQVWQCDALYDELPKGVGLWLANLQLAPLQELAWRPDLPPRLIVSGLLAGEELAIPEYRVAERRTRDGWEGLLLVREEAP